MPRHPLDPNLILGPEAEAPAPTAGGWAPIAAAATRGVSGLIGGTHPVVGAIAGGGGEALAQLIEALGGIGEDQTLGQRLGRVGVEAATGAVPFGKVAKSGELLYNLLRGGALGGVGAAAREYATTGEVNPMSVAASTALGGASAAGAQKLFDVIGGAAGKTPSTVGEVVPTSQTARVPRTRAITPRGPQSDSQIPVASAPPTPKNVVENVVDDFDDEAFNAIMGPGVSLGGTPRVPYGGPSVEASRSFQRSETAAQRAQDAAWAQEARNMNAAEKAQGNIDRLAEIEAQRAAAGVEAKPPTFSESMSAQTPEGGRASMSTRYAPPTEEPEPGLAELLAGPRRGPNGGVERLEPPPPAPAIPATLSPEVDPIARFFNSRVDAAGAGYREAKAAGDVPRDILGRVHGRALQREGQEAGLPPRGPIPANAPSAPEVAQPDWVAKEMSVVDRLKQLMLDQASGGTLANRGPGKGFVYPEVASTLATAGIGGLAGYAADPFGNPLMSALAGAAAGGVAPHLPALARGGADYAGEFVDKARESVGSLDDVKELALQGIEKIPNFQRFNLLSSPSGLISNAILGPYGSAMMGSLERGLAGDARGWDAIREVGNPVNFLRRMHTGENLGESVDLVRKGELGRAEFGDVSNPTALDDVLSSPGTYMTMGDRTAKQSLMGAGFGEDEARKMTLTSEPERPLGRFLAHFGSGGGDDAQSRLQKVAMSTMLPFRRTPANILEQGLDRLPVVGAGMQLMNKGDANWRELGAQQLLGAGTMGANYVAGDQIEDPTLAREARRALSNVGGQYSLPASLGFAAGQAHQKGQSRKQFARSATRELFPVPATRPVEENLDALGSMFFGEPGDEVKLPSGMRPAVFRELIDEPEEPDTLPNLPTFRFRR